MCTDKNTAYQIHCKTVGILSHTAKFWEKFEIKESLFVIEEAVPLHAMEAHWGEEV
jgi:hypothetical protein